MDCFKSIARKLSGASTEKPEYAVLPTFDYTTLEFRQYEKSVWVSVKTVSQERMNAKDQLLGKLVRYMQGENSAGKNMDMTAPVITKVHTRREHGENGDVFYYTFTVSVYIGKKHWRDIPTPTDPELFIERWAPWRCLVHKISGFATENAWMDQIDEVSTLWMKVAQRSNVPIIIDHFFTAAYDSPCKLFNRINEIWAVTAIVDENCMLQINPSTRVKLFERSPGYNGVIVVSTKPGNYVRVYKPSPSNDDKVVEVSPSNGDKVVEVSPSIGDKVVEVSPSNGDKAVEVSPSNDDKET